MALEAARSSLGAAPEQPGAARSSQERVASQAAPGTRPPGVQISVVRTFTVAFTRVYSCKLCLGSVRDTFGSSTAAKIAMGLQLSAFFGHSR